MPPKDDRLYLGHMLDTARQAFSKVQGKSRAEYDQDENLRLALAHLIQTIGEAARRVTPETQKANPRIPWSEVIGMRHKIVHDYLDVDFDIIWEVVTNDLPGLVKQLAGIIPEE